MSTLSLRIPDSLQERIRELAQQDGISISQFISTAAEKMDRCGAFVVGILSGE